MFRLPRGLQEMSARAWRKLIDALWAVAFWALLLGKALPEHDCVTPPCLADDEPASKTGRLISIVSAFSFSSVLITGAHGYLGSLVLEQILRLCPTVNRVYVITAKYLEATGHTNAYTLSKHMTEEVIRDLHRAGVPCTIVRPSIVGAVAKHPCPGYFGNTTSGLVALFLGYSTGMSTFTPHNPSNAMDIVPGDICAATILAASAAVIQDNVCPYWGARKPWYVRSLHQAVRTPWRFPLAQDTPLFRAWTAAKTCKFWALACMLTLMGQQRKALQITKGWQVTCLS
ncbi:hypothetical protein WJX73_001101 [Symbiochloris irregularis]|uniref:Fatty acyl-CoA reductase n=1 Tax=Symbiochloris irregularis TaxID=706552 RepID=A0AAW1NM99_9CHLO